MKLFISPHSDDSVLYGAFTLLRERPLVLTVTDSYIQANRGDPVTTDQRWLEDIEAMKILNCPLIFGSIRDDVIDEWAVKDLLGKFYNFEKVYAPAVQGGNKDHDLIGRLAKERFGDKVIQYSTYAPQQFYTLGTKEIIGTPEEMELKNKALDCYKSQVSLESTAKHFSEVRGKSEWYI